jgi:DNA-binding MarR family transcriptional regulator
LNEKHARINLPDDLFRSFALLLPDFLRLIEDCGLDGVEIFTLVYLGNHGTPLDSGRKAILRSDFTQLLRREFHYSDGDVDLHLGRMEEKGLVLRQRLTHDQKRRYFNIDKGRLAVVVLLPGGQERTAKLKAGLSGLFSDVLSRVPGSLLPLVLKFLPVLTSVAKALLASVQRAQSATNSRP